MKNAYYRIINSIKIGLWAFNNAETLNGNNFKMLSDLLGLILKVAKESRPIMSQIAFIHPDSKEKHDIVSVWAGAGLGADPYNRIMELQKEISRLKALLLDNVKQTEK